MYASFYSAKCAVPAAKRCSLVSLLEKNDDFSFELNSAEENLTGHNQTQVCPQTPWSVYGAHTVQYETCICFSHVWPLHILGKTCKKVFSVGYHDTGSLDCEVSQVLTIDALVATILVKLISSVYLDCCANRELWGTLVFYAREIAVLLTFGLKMAVIQERVMFSQAHQRVGKMLPVRKHDYKKWDVPHSHLVPVHQQMVSRGI